MTVAIGIDNVVVAAVDNDVAVAVAIIVRVIEIDGAVDDGVDVVDDAGNGVVVAGITVEMEVDDIDGNVDNVALYVGRSHPQIDKRESSLFDAFPFGL